MSIDFNKGIVKRLNRYQMILPIKPKPFLIKKKSTHLSSFFAEDSKLKELIRGNRKESEPNALNIGQVRRTTDLVMNFFYYLTFFSSNF